jgi:hypothetical protein
MHPACQPFVWQWQYSFNAGRKYCSYSEATYYLIGLLKTLKASFITKWCKCRSPYYNMCHPLANSLLKRETWYRQLDLTVYKERNCVQNVSELVLYKAPQHYTVIYVTNKNTLKILQRLVLHKASEYYTTMYLCKILYITWPCPAQGE